MDNPPTSGRQIEIVKRFGNHVVGLQVDYVQVGGDHLSRIELLTGFVFDFNDTWIWLTAGHGLSDIEKAVKNGHIRITGSRWIDFFGNACVSTHGIPADYLNLWRECCHDDELGLDLGFVVLDTLTKKLIAANGIKAFGVHDFLSPDSLDFDRYWVAGFPFERAKDLGESVTAGLVAFPLDRVWDPPGVLSKPTRRFHAKIPHLNNIESLKGISGGPVFGFKKCEEGVRYWVVALQNGWDQKEHVAACPADLFITGISGYLSQFLPPDE